MGDIPGFVVDDQQRAVIEPVDAVETQVESKSSDGYGPAGFSLGHFKSDACSLEFQPLDDMPCQPHFFEFKIAAGHSVANCRAKFLLNNSPNMIDNKRLQGADVVELVLEADAIRGASPNRVKYGMKKFAALGGSQASFRRLPVLRGEAGGSKSFERALGLGREDACAARYLGQRVWNSAEVFDGNGDRVRQGRGD